MHGTAPTLLVLFEIGLKVTVLLGGAAVACTMLGWRP
jgi:hypothetical protein